MRLDARSDALAATDAERDERGRRVPPTTRARRERNPASQAGALTIASMERSGNSGAGRGPEHPFWPIVAGGIARPQPRGAATSAALVRGTRRLRASAITVVALIVMLLGMLGSPLAANAATTPTPTPGSTEAATPGALTLALAPDNGGTLAAGQDLGLTVTLSNSTAEVVPATIVHVWLDRTQLSTRAELSTWLGSDTTGETGETGDGGESGAASGGDTSTPAAATPAAAATSEVAPSEAATSAAATASGAGEASEAAAAAVPAPAPVQGANTVAVEVVSPAIAPGTTATLRASIPAAQLALGAWGAYGIEALASASATGTGLALGADTLASGVWSTSVVTWSVGAPATAATIGLIMPLTVAPLTSGLLSATQLAADTAPDGVLTTKLDGVIGRPVTLAIDPLIIVSIRVLGTAAPQSALNWLAKLAAAPNPTFELAYADADLAVQRAAGSPALLTPTSFDYALSQTNFQTLPSPDPFALPGQVSSIDPLAPAGAAGSAGSAGAATPTPTATPTPAAGALPTFTDLTAWNYTRTDIAWPASGTVSTGDLEYFAASGLGTSILSSTNVSTPEAGATPNAPATIGSSNVIVADAQLTDALQNAVGAPTQAPRDAALAEVSAELAIITAQAGGTAPALVASLGRSAPSSAFAVTHTLDTVETLPWAAEVPLGDVLTAAQTAGVTLVDSPEAPARVAAVSSMLGSEHQVSDFAPVIDQPELITGKQRASLLAVLAQSWLADSDGASAAITAYDKASNATLTSVQIVDGSTVNLLATNGDVPVPISNDLDQAVTVTLQVTASNGRLVVEPSSIDVTIEAHSQKTAKVPVKAAVATGQVELGLQLYNKNGVLVSQAEPLQINVSADWEGIGTLVIGILAVLLLAFGVVRQVLKRRRARRAAAAGITPGDAVGETNASGRVDVRDPGDTKHPTSEPATDHPAADDERDGRDG
ncbi:MAG: rane protein [Subtercola sp.]|nr:rane protein [Subtercola sp.]